MSAKVDVLDADAIEPSPGAPAYIRALGGAGPDLYVDNARVEMKGLVVDGKLLPLVINDGSRRNSHVCSSFAHYLSYTLEELSKRNRRLSPRLLTVVGLPIRAALTVCAIDRAAFVNNWLFSTNPSPGLSFEQVAALTPRLVESYPRSALVFRSINPLTDRPSSDALRENKYRMVRSRRIYMLDPSGAAVKKNLHRDLELLRTTPYDVVRSHEALEPHAPRLAELYRDLYLVKHTPLNPAYNARFIRLTLEEAIFTYLALVREGRVDAFAAYFVDDGLLTGAIIGYDRLLPQALGLYRLAISLLIAEGLALGLPINLSGGAGAFKMHRGAVPVEEFDAVYDRHLPTPERAAWAALAAVQMRAAARGPQPLD